MQKQIAALALTALVTLGACGGDGDDVSVTDPAAVTTEGSDAGAESTEAPSGGDGTISYAFSLGPATLDPDRITSGQAALYLMPVYDRLVQIDPLTSELLPMLATEWEVGSDESGDYVDFTLQEGLTFPDGASFGPETVIANIERSQATEGSLTGADLAAVTGAEAVSDNVVRVRTEGGAGWLPAVMGTAAGMMISQDAIGNDDLATKPVGIGMWTLDRFDPALVTYSATTDYWDREVQEAKRLELHHIPDDSARFNAVRSGDLDATFIRPNQISEVEPAGLNLVRADGTTTYGVAFNTSRPGLDSQMARQALQHAIDREAVAEQLLGGECAPNAQLWSSAWPAYDDEIEVPEYDPELAREMLAEAGVGDSLQISLAAYDIDQYRRLAEIMQAQFAEIGVGVDIQIMPASNTREAFGVQQSVDAAQTTPGLEADASQTVAQYLLPDSPMNPGGDTDDAIVDLAEQALGASDPEARAELYQEISALALEDASMLMVCSPNFLFVTADSISGFEGARAAGAPEWRGVGA